jgi:uncharacterized protein YndB with AHSA1/START domain
MSKPVAIAVQHFKAPPARLYEAVLDADMIARFMFGPLLREEEILGISIDPKIGGEFSYKVRRGETVIDHVGKFLELKKPTRIAFTWSALDNGRSLTDADLSTVTIDIEPTKDGCKLTLAHEMPPQWADFVNQARGSWEKMLGVLSTLVPDRPKVADKPDRIALIFIKSEPQKVWDAVVSDVASKDYFMGRSVHVGANPGTPFSIVNPDGKISEEGVVLVSRPPGILRVTWQPVWDRSIPQCEVEWTIAAEKTTDGSPLTRLTVCEYHQNGLPKQFEEAGRTGWAIILSGIKSILETGQPLPAMKFD